MEKIVEKYPSNKNKYSYTYDMNKGANMKNEATTWTMTFSEFSTALDKMKDVEQLEKIAARQKSEVVPAYKGMSDAAFFSMLAPARAKNGGYRV